MIRLSTILIVLFVVSCQQESRVLVQKPNVKNFDSLNTIIGKISASDTACLKQIRYAQKQISQGELTYNLYMTPMSYGRQENELKELLKPYGINCKVFLTSCGGQEYGRSYCYADYMNQTIKAKFKNGFIDSLEAKADRIFLMKNIRNVYHSMDEYDETIFYPNAKDFDNQRDEIRKDFLSSFRYPKDFKLSHKEHAGRSIVDFTLYRNGEIKDITIETEFEQSTNEKFIPYFNSELEKFVKRIKWIPRKQRGIAVNGHLGFWIPYKQGSR